MTWFRVDDSLWGHPKAREAGVPAVGLWVLAGSYCGQQLTDGWVPAWWVKQWPQGLKLADRLVAVGMWTRHADGYRFHQWEQANPTRAQVEAERAAARKRQAEWKARRAEQEAGNAVGNAVSNGSANTAPTRPDPTRPFLVLAEVEEEVEVSTRVRANGKRS